MGSLINQLPADVARQVHPDWRKNEADYWAARDHLLAPYCGQWIGFANGRVIVSSLNPVEVLEAAQKSQEHPFVTRVGHEEQPLFRNRRSSFPYDSGYPGPPLPVVSVELRKQPGATGVALDDVIPDTGADASALPWGDCQQIGLDLANGIPAIMGGVGATALPTVLFSAWAYLDGNDYSCQIQADFTGTERILGRDVLNQLDVLFRGPGREVVINP